MEVLYGGRGGSAASDLYTIDPTTGSGTSIGPTGYAITGLAVDPTTGILYASTSQQSPIHPRAIITIDPTTGAATFIGNQNLVAGVAGPHAARDICFDASGQMWGFCEHHILAGRDDLLIFDKSTGQGTQIETHGATGGDDIFAGSGYACDIGNDGLLYLTSNNPTCQVYSVDVNTAESVLLFDIPSKFGVPFSAAAFTLDKASLYAVSNEIGVGTDLTIIDLDTGAVTEIGPSLSSPALDAIAWAVSFSVGPGVYLVTHELG